MLACQMRCSVNTLIIIKSFIYFISVKIMGGAYFLFISIMIQDIFWRKRRTQLRQTMNNQLINESLFCFLYCFVHCTQLKLSLKIFGMLSDIEAAVRLCGIGTTHTSINRVQTAKCNGGNLADWFRLRIQTIRTCVNFQMIRSIVCF